MVKEFIKLVYMNLKKIADSRYAYLEQVEDGKFRNAMLGAAMGASALGGMASCGDDPLEDDNEPTKYELIDYEQKSDIIDATVFVSENNGAYSVKSTTYPLESIALILTGRNFDADVIGGTWVKTNATPDDLRGIFSDVRVKESTKIENTGNDVDSKSVSYKETYDTGYGLNEAKFTIRNADQSILQQVNDLYLRSSEVSPIKNGTFTVTMDKKSTDYTTLKNWLGENAIQSFQ